MSVYQQQAEELLARYHEKRARAGELRRKLDGISANATASRNVVKVSVNGKGQVIAIEFLTSAYKRTPPAELAKILMDTIQEATGKALEAVRELMTPELPSGLNFMDMLQGKADAPAILAQAEARLPEEVRQYIGDEPDKPSGGKQSE
jgi:DNA-binding protein YbaB